jgi:hypothetical protein
MVSHPDSKQLLTFTTSAIAIDPITIIDRGQQSAPAASSGVEKEDRVLLACNHRLKIPTIFPNPIMNSL